MVTAELCCCTLNGVSGLGGSPATAQMSSGVETVDLDESQASEQENQSSSLDTSLTTTETEGVHIVDSTLLNQASRGEPSSQSRVRQRRAFLDEKLSNYKQEKLKRKLPVDSQLAKEEIEVRKRLLDQMDRMEMQYNENMSKLSANMDRLTNSIADGFALLRGLLLPQQPAYHSQQHPMYGLYLTDSTALLQLAFFHFHWLTMLVTCFSINGRSSAHSFKKFSLRILKFSFHSSGTTTSSIKLSHQTRVLPGLIQNLLGLLCRA